MPTGALLAASALISPHRNDKPIQCMLADLWEDNPEHDDEGLAGAQELPHPTRHTPGGELKRELGRCKRQLAHSKAVSRKFRTLQESVSRVAFADTYGPFHKAAHRNSHRDVVVQLPDGEWKCYGVDKKQDMTINDRARRGIHSHVQGQETALVQILGEHKWEYLILQAVYDDVSTWVKTSTATTLSLNFVSESSLDRLSVATLLGLLQDVFLRRQNGGTLHHISINCPGQLLSKANIATMRDRLCNWLLFSSRGVGSKLIKHQDANAHIQNLLRAIPLTILLHTKDALCVNNGLVAVEQKLIFEHNRSLSAAEPGHVAMLPIVCVHHTASLAKRAAILDVPAVATALVKGSHVMQSGSLRRRYTENLGHYFKHHFKRKPVLAMPPGYSEWIKKTSS